MGEVLYKMATMARLGGVAPVLLRTWERRHGFFEPQRTPGGHRLYTEDDLRVLKSIKRHLREGRSIGEVEALGRASLLGGPPDAVGGGASTAARRGAAEPPATERWTSAIVKAALELQPGLASKALDEAFAGLSPERAIAEVVEPAMRTIGELWAKERCGVAGEHLVSELVGTRLRSVWAAASAAGEGRYDALVTCLPDEQHALGSLTVALLLCRRQRRVRWLGAALPLTDLERVCAETKPAQVLLSVSRAALVDLHAAALSEVARRLPGSRFVVGGPGVLEGRHDPRVEYVVGRALDLDLEALGRTRARPRKASPVRAS
jgi:DNA-binding transcriptional MerR regulator